MPSSLQHFGVCGAGAWGTALALALTRAGRRVTLATRRAEHAAALIQNQENSAYLPGVALPHDLYITSDPLELAGCDTLILASPAQHLREVCEKLKPFIRASLPVIITCKGIEKTTYRLMSEVVSEALPHNPLFILSGPSFAAEVAHNMPAALTLAGESNGERVAQAMASPRLRLYTTDDIIGAQIGGAVKNVLAIACGIVTGRQLGENARAALITRGLAEIIRLGTALGGRTETLMGLSCLGDIALTCTSSQSRNMALGIALGKGKQLSLVISESKGVAEGVATSAATLGLARRHGIDMPVVSSVDMILREQASIDDIIETLLARPLRNEAA